MNNDPSITPDDLASFPGAPFTHDQIEAAIGAIRSAAEWHIAPEITETIHLDVHHCRAHLQLPTLRIVSIAEVRDVDTDEVIPVSDYRLSHKLCTLRRRDGGFWPEGYERIAITFTHGYTEMPKELLAVIADAANLANRDQRLRSIGIDDFQESYGSITTGSDPLSSAAILNRYSLSGGRSLYGLGIA